MISTARLRRAARRESVGVDVSAGLNLVGSLITYFALASLVPAAVAIGYGESPWPFVVAGAAAGSFGAALEAVTHGRERVGSREGFLVVSVLWLLAAVFGAIPYVLSGEAQLSSPIDAYFESMSGFSTTGSSVLTDIEALDHSTAMWRQLTQWIGGMGIIVLALAVLPRLRVGGRQLLQLEAPGPEVDTLAATIRQTAKRFVVLYVAPTGRRDLAADEAAVRAAVFNVVSAMTTTGYANADLNGWRPRRNDPARADVRERLGRVDERLDQARAARPVGGRRDRADVARAAGDRPRRRPLHEVVLAGVT